MAAFNLLRHFTAARSESHSRRRFRPMLEVLDARDVPALLTWTDATGDGQFSTPGNWNSSDIPSGSPQLATPHAGDDLLFVNFASAGGGGSGNGITGASGPGGGSPDCDGMQSDPAGPYNAIFVTGGYTGTITVTGPVQTLALEMAAPGTIDQPIASADPTQPGGSDITVMGGEGTTPANADLISTLQGDFTWNMGTINSTANLSNLWLQNCTASINPGGVAVTTGDNINMTNVAPATLGQGTLTLDNGASLALNGGSTFVVDPGPESTATIIETAPFPAIIVSPTNLLTINSGQDTIQGRVKVTGGTFTLQPQATVTLVGQDGNGVTFSQTSGNTILGPGSELALKQQMNGPSNGNMVINSGTLVRQTTANNDTSMLGAVISGNLTVNDGDIYVETPGVSGVTIVNSGFGVLSVFGNITWNGGTYHPVVVGWPQEGYGGSGTAASDYWKANGTFTVGVAAFIDPIVLDSDCGYRSAPYQDGSWDILSGGGGIIGNPNAVGVLNPSWTVTGWPNPPVPVVVKDWYLNYQA